MIRSWTTKLWIRSITALKLWTHSREWGTGEQIRALDTDGLDAFPRMGDGSMDDAEIRTTRKNLLAYCGLDTLAMVKVLEKLQELVDTE